MTIHCPECRRKLQVPDNTAGRRAHCPACRSKFVIPDPNDAQQQTIHGLVLEDESQTDQEQEDKSGEPQ